MAEPWIKMRSGLRDCPEVIALGEMLNPDGTLSDDMAEMLAVGMLHATWALADGQSIAGHLERYTEKALDRKIGHKGWAEMLKSVGWLESVDGGLFLPGFETHNGMSAKKRANAASRKEKERRTLNESPSGGVSRIERDSVPAPERDDVADPERDDVPISSPLLSSSGSGSGSGSEGEAPRTQPAAASGSAALEAAIGSTLPPPPPAVVAAAREFCAHEAEYGKHRQKSTWAKRLGDAARDPAAFRATVDHSIGAGWCKLVPPEPAIPGKAPGSALTARGRQHESNLAAIAEFERRAKSGAPGGASGLLTDGGAA